MINAKKQDMAIVKDILRTYFPECEVRAFGSRVDGKPKAYSDLDLAIIGSEKLNRKVKANLKYAFEKSNLPYRVDILDWHAISESFRKLIEAQYEVIQKPLTP